MSLVVVVDDAEIDSLKRLGCVPISIIIFYGRFICKNIDLFHCANIFSICTIIYTFI